MNAKQNLDRIWFQECLDDNDLVDKLKKIQLIMTDIDGSLTNAYFAYTESKEESRQFSIQDGFGLRKAYEAGILIGFLSGKKHDSALLRAKKLGIPDDLCYIGRDDKLDVITKIQQSRNISSEQTMIFGDDHYDAVVKMKSPQIIFAAPANTPFYYQTIADIVTTRTGGEHAFRRLIDLILYVQNKHFAQDIITQSLS